MIGIKKKWQLVSSLTIANKFKNLNLFNKQKIYRNMLLKLNFGGLNEKSYFDVSNMFRSIC